MPLHFQLRREEEFGAINGLKGNPLATRSLVTAQGKVGPIAQPPIASVLWPMRATTSSRCLRIANPSTTGSTPPR